MEKTLEELSFENSEFLDKKQNKINPKPIGPPLLFHTTSSDSKEFYKGLENYLLANKNNEKHIQEANAFLIGGAHNILTQPYHYVWAVQLYKI